MASPSTNLLKSYLAGIRPPVPAGQMATEGLEAATVGAEPEPESIAARAKLSKSQTEIVRSALDKIDSDQELNQAERFVTEAIIIPDKRPAIDIVNGDFTIDHPLWMQFQNDAALHASICEAIPSVGRIELPGHPSLPYGGTGWVVGDGLLMTNRHVAEIFATGLGTRNLVFRQGLGAGIDFERERDSKSSTVLGVRRVVMIHPYWDMALLSVDGLGAEHAPLVLSVAAADQAVNNEIVVIGFPAFDSRNDPAVQNEVFRGLYNVKRLQPGLILPRASIGSFGKTVSALCHDSSTLGGNSGSVVFNPRTKRVIALHFAGVYLDRNYCVPAAELALDGRVLDAGVRFENGATGGSPPWNDWWEQTERETSASVATPAATQNIAPAPAAPDGALALGESRSWTIPIEITVRVGASPTISLSATSASAPAPTEAMVEPIHDPDYSRRKGYDAAFLGLAVPPPAPSNPEDVVRFGSGPLIPYHHFSLALHKARRIPLFTACNLDASGAARQPEAGQRYDRKSLGSLGVNDMEKWFSDPRIDPVFQLPDRFFTKDRGAFDRGHVVRREDVAWGKDFREVQFANGDTFHVTNCSPQVKGFNQSAQGVDNWGDLENYVARQAGASRLSIFAGPVLAKDDPVFVGVDDVGPVRIQIPRQYWKVIVAADGGKLRSFGFLLKQDLSDTPLEFSVDATWRKFMVPLTDLQTLNPLVRFDKLVLEGDQAGGSSGEAVREAAETPMLPG